MEVHTSRRRFPCFVVAFCAALACWSPGTSEAARILMHGREEGPTFRNDPEMFDHLVSLFGEGNVDYMAAISAAADGSTANGYDAIVISSSMGSNDIRGKYEDTRVGVLNMENAIVDMGAGEFQMSSASGNSLAVHDQVDIVNADHPLAAGLSGAIQVFNSQQSMQVARGLLAPGAIVIATQAAGNAEGSADPAIFAVDAGGELLGDGSEEMPAVAAGRRVMFFVSDPGFADLTEDGVKLFDAAVNWAAVPEPGSFALCAIGLFGLLGRRPARR
jgi:hypothetical protein